MYIHVVHKSDQNYNSVNIDTHTVTHYTCVQQSQSAATCLIQVQLIKPTCTCM